MHMSWNFNGSLMPKSISYIAFPLHNKFFIRSLQDREECCCLIMSFSNVCLLYPRYQGGFCSLNSVFPWYVTYLSLLEFIYRVSSCIFNCSTDNDKIFKTCFKNLDVGLITANRLWSLLGEVQELWTLNLWNKNMK